MPLLRALAHLVIAMALLAAAQAPARALGPALDAVSQHGSHIGGHAPNAHIGHAGHDHGAPAGEAPAHTPDCCQTACCFVPAQSAARHAGIATIAFSCAVRYPDSAQRASGRGDAPEPGIPKAVIA
jgi:hypothetical protein